MKDAVAWPSAATVTVGNPGESSYSGLFAGLLPATHARMSSTIRQHHPFIATMRASLARADTFIGGLGIFLICSIVVAAVATWLFGEIAEIVTAGKTQAFDEAVLRWLGAHRTKSLDSAMLEITTLGTGIVVMTVVAVSALFLSLTRHRYSALLLLVATAGGLILNTVLKLFFDRPRPHVIVWETHAASSSFPSGHAMSATIVYTCVAYLAARLARHRWQRWTVMFIAAFVVILISTSRLYLGVHYPSDVLAGAVVGLAWAAFCMATLETIQKFSQRVAPEIQKDEKPAPKAVSL